MNTPDMEWEKEVRTFVNELASQLTPSNDTMNAIRLIRNDLPDFIKYMRTSRDTYWKERVGETVGKIEESARTQDTSYEYGEGTYEGMMHSIFILKDITNEDNLK